MSERDCFDCPHPAGDHAPGRPECYGCLEDDPNAYACRVTFTPVTLSERQEQERSKEIAEAYRLVYETQKVLHRLAMWSPEKVAA